MEAPILTPARTITPPARFMEAAKFAAIEGEQRAELVIVS